jgi:catechol 2,3-dioxygenase-like lactoylglutathione lyase family enzyme
VISRIDHLTIAVRDADVAADAYRRLLGREPQIQDGMGSRRVWFRFPNLALEVLGPFGEGVSGDRLRKRLETAGEGLWLMCFRVDDLEGAVQLLNRRGLPMESLEATRPAAMGSAAGIAVTLVTPREDPMSAPVGPEASAVAALDHVVVHTPNPDRALAIYGAKLGLDLRLDRENPQWGARQMFFRCGDAVIEIGASLKAPMSDAPDSFGGLAWRVTDPEAARARMAAAGFDVSELRTGRKPGTKVFTVRDAPGGVPTLMLSAEPVAA